MCGGADMSFWELLALVGTVATILGISLTIYALINNKTLKEESRLTREIILEESRHTREILDKIAQLIVSEGEKTRQAIRA